jgi:SAM-dependent methyltransferase
MDAQYWNSLYLSGDTGWDKGKPSPPVARMLREGVLKPRAAIAVIGCGKGHEAIEAARLGFRVTAVDFAPEAIKAVRENAAKANVTLTALEKDLFEIEGRFDAVLEHTCFCAIDVELRAKYVEKIAALLEPKGTLFGVFYAHGKPGGPPFDTSEAEVRERFGPSFELERLRVAPDSLQNRAGKELEAVLRRRSN